MKHLKYVVAFLALASGFLAADEPLNEPQTRTLTAYFLSSVTNAPLTGFRVKFYARIHVVTRDTYNNTILNQHDEFRGQVVTVAGDGSATSQVTFTPNRNVEDPEWGLLNVREIFIGWEPEVLQCTPVQYVNSNPETYKASLAAAWNANSISIGEAGINKYLGRMYPPRNVTSGSYTGSNYTLSYSLQSGVPTVDMLSNGSITLSYPMTGNVSGWINGSPVNLTVTVVLSLTTTPSYRTNADGTTSVGINVPSTSFCGSLVITTPNYPNEVRSRLCVDLLSRLLPDTFVGFTPPVVTMRRSNVYGEMQAASTPFIVSGGTSSDQMTFYFNTRWAVLY